MYSTAGLNNVVVWCKPNISASFRGMGKTPLDKAHAFASIGRHMGDCVFVASPAHMPIFDWPFSPNLSLPANYHGSGFDFERAPYGALSKQVDYRGLTVQFLDDHDAHDFGMPPGTPLYAVADGVVITGGMFYGTYTNCNVVPNLPTETGKSDCGHQGLVIVRHTVKGSSPRYDEIFATGYSHIQAIPRWILSGCTPVDTGKTWPGAGGVCNVPVKRGQVVAYSGRRNTNQAHLHFATWRLSNNSRRDGYGYRAPDAALHSPNCCNSAGAIGPTMYMEPYGWRGPVGDPWSYKARASTPTFPFGAGALSIRLWKTDPPIHWQ
jgi:murein DD-endopeptidase MepM/ murein hydrolase activator NlpD